MTETVRDVSQQTVLITGAASGLGRALATAFARAGAALVLVDFDESGLLEVRSELPYASIYLADLSNAESTRRMIGEVRADHPTVDTLIHNAGFLVPQTFAEMAPDRWDLTFNVGIQAAHLLTRAFWADWLRTGAAALYVSSRSGIEGFVGETAYCASKHAIEGFVKALGTECAESDIRVHSITPGVPIHTRMSEQNYTPELKANWVDPMELTPAFLYLAKRKDKALSGRRLDAWELSKRIRAGLL